MKLSDEFYIKNCLECTHEGLYSCKLELITENKQKCKNYQKHKQGEIAR